VSEVREDAVPLAPEVSVVIPTRNRWSLLCTAGLRAALSQDGVSLEVLVVDDGSGHPGTGRELDDPRVRIVRGSRRGLAAARNYGIEAARGGWIAFLDDDDLWSPRKLREQLSVAASAGADFVYCAAVLVNTSDGSALALRLPSPSELPSWLSSSSAIPAGASNVLARTELVRGLDGFDERFSHLADWDLWIRLEQAGSAAACAEVLVAECLHEGNMRAVATRSVWAEFRQLAAKRRLATAGAGDASLDGRALLAWIASQHARSGRRPEALFWYIRAAAASRSLGLLREGIRVLGAGAQPQPASGAAPPAWVETYL
jgi:glycosyltransferase involved in cell wall biosynthesis